MQACRHSLCPFLYFGISFAVNIFVMLWLFLDGIFWLFWQPSLVLLAQALDHVNQIAVFSIQLFDAFLIALEPGDAHFMTPWQFMFVFLKVLCNLLWVMLVHEADGADSGGARGCNRRLSRSNVVAAYLSANGVGKRWSL